MKLFGGRSGEQTKSFLATFWRLPPHPPSLSFKARKFLAVAAPAGERRRLVRATERAEGAPEVHTTNSNAYADVSNHCALGALGARHTFVLEVSAVRLILEMSASFVV